MFEDAGINFRIVILYSWLLKKLVWRISYNLPENGYIFCHLAKSHFWQRCELYFEKNNLVRQRWRL